MCVARLGTVQTEKPGITASLLTLAHFRLPRGTHAQIHRLSRVSGAAIDDKFTLAWGIRRSRRSENGGTRLKGARFGGGEMTTWVLCPASLRESG